MVKLTLRIPEDVNAKLKILADGEHRSANSMMVVLIERAAAGQDRSDSPGGAPSDHSRWAAAHPGDPEAVRAVLDEAQVAALVAPRRPRS